MSSSNGVKASDRPQSKVCNVEDCSAWKTGELDFCHHHKGMASNGVPEEGNQRAQKHGLYSVPEHLKKHFTESQEDRYIAYFESLCSRYERLHGQEPDAFAKDRLSRISIECVKERIADEWLSEKADETGNLLIEEYIIDTDEQGQPVKVESENQILKELTALKRETRLQLKDMGLLKDPESKKADNMEGLAEMWAESLED